MEPFINAMKDARGIIDVSWSFPPSPMAGESIPEDFTQWSDEIVDSICETCGYPLDADDKWRAVDVVRDILTELHESGFDEKNDDDDFWKGLTREL